MDDLAGNTKDNELDPSLFDLNLPSYQNRSPAVTTPKYTTPAQQRFLDQYSIQESVTIDAAASDNNKQLSKLER